MSFKLPYLLAVALLTGAAAPATTEHGALWLDKDSPRTMKWVRARTDETVKRLSARSDFATLEAEAATVLTDPGIIEGVTFQGDQAFQYHQEKSRPQGVWRSTPAAAYLAGKPVWTTIIDLDALSAAEGKRFFLDGASCRKSRCLVRLSDNGKDAVEWREFDLSTKSFLADGFRLPSGRSRAWWWDDDTLLVAPITDRASINEHLGPKTVRLWKRGTPLAKTRPIFSIGDGDAMLSVSFVRAGGTDAFIAARHIDFEAREYQLMTGDGASRPLALPRYATMMGVHDGRLLLRPNEAWTPEGGTTFAAGSLVAISLDALMKDARISGTELLYTPEGDDAVRSTVSGDGRLFVEVLHDYFTRLVELKPGASAWAARRLPLDDGRFRSIIAWRDGALMMREEAPLVPERLVLANPDTGALRVLAARAPQFASDDLVSELWRTVSKDGTPIDYLVTHKRGMALDGSHPTLVYGYGGYDVPLTPRYEPLFGKLWLERGGVYVHAYLRGGGEQRAPWHRGAMRLNRQQPYDDMAAVLTDLHRRGVTVPARTGIMGRSNGGLMVAAVMEQRPELLGAVVVGGPLIDMLNFHELPPGGTWTAEYGDPRDPAMRPFLASYSPMQNIAPASTRYPVPLIITATDDDRVLPGHARRFSERLSALGHENLYYEDDQGGHYWELGGGPIPGDWRRRARARAVEFSYLWDRLGRAK